MYVHTVFRCFRICRKQIYKYRQSKYQTRSQQSACIIAPKSRQISIDVLTYTQTFVQKAVLKQRTNHQVSEWQAARPQLLRDTVLHPSRRCLFEHSWSDQNATVGNTEFSDQTLAWTRFTLRPACTMYHMSLRMLADFPSTDFTFSRPMKSLGNESGGKTGKKDSTCTNFFSQQTCMFAGKFLRR